MAIALYPGKFKPPHRGHFEAVKRLLTGEHRGVIFDKESQKDAAGEILKEEKQVENIDKVVIVVSAKTTEVVSLEQSLDIWNIYKPYLESYGQVEIVQVDVSKADTPVAYTKELLNDKEHFYLAVGLRDITDVGDLSRSSITDKHNNYEALVFTLGPEFNVRATNLRNAVNYKQKEEIRKFLPDELQDSDKEKIIDILLKGSKKTESALSKKIATQVEGVFNAWFDKDEPVKDPLKEGSGGTPIAPMSAIKSSDRNKLDTLYHRLRNQIGDDFYTIIFNQDHIRIQLKGSGLNETLESESFDFTPHIASMLEYMIDEGMNILPIPEVKLVRDEHNAKELFGKTAHYNPVEKEIVLYIEGRHPKDVLRSFAHEMIHHKQNLEGRLHNISTTNTNEDDNLLELEKEAYLEGNIMFRMLEDGIKNSEENLNEDNSYTSADKVADILAEKHSNAFREKVEDYGPFIYEENESVNIEGFSFDLELTLKLDENLKASQGEAYAVMDNQEEDDDLKDDDLIQIEIHVNPKLPKPFTLIQKLLFQYLVHEIEHLEHGEGINRKNEKFIPEDRKIRDLINFGALPSYTYRLLPREIAASVAEFKAVAKASGRDFYDIVNEELTNDGYNEEEKKIIVEAYKRYLNEESPKFTVYCDMDGVLCDFDKQFQSLEDSKGMTPSQFEDQGGNIYPIIGKEGEKFWSEMDWMPNGKKLWEGIKQYNPTILTSPFKPTDPNMDIEKEPSRKGKKAWCKKNLGISEDRIKFAGKISRPDLPKPKFKYAKANTILIDDTDANIDPFNQEGGIGLIYFDSNVDEVLEKINKLQTGK